MAGLIKTIASWTAADLRRFIQAQLHNDPTGMMVAADIGRVADSELLDGRDSTDFASALTSTTNIQAKDSNKLQGHISSHYASSVLNTDNNEAKNSLLFDGQDSTNYASSTANADNNIAKNADKLDNRDSTDFASAVGSATSVKAKDADLLDSRDSTDFASAVGSATSVKAKDSDLLDGIDSTGFALVTHASAHAPGAADPIDYNVVNLAGTLASRPGAATANKGLLYFATDFPAGTGNGQLYRSNGVGWVPITGSVDGAPPFGAMEEYAGSSDPSTSWLICDGRSLLRSVYAGLFTALGGAASPWGLPDGTHFNIPDCRSRASVGAGTGTGLSNRALAATGGEEAHALSLAELASHNHGGATGTQSANHQHGFGGGFYVPWGDGAGFNQNTVQAGATYTVKGISATDSENATHTHSVSSAGSGTAHNNMQPWVATNKIIRVL